MSTLKNQLFLDKNILTIIGCGVIIIIRIGPR
nr:MAG TPA: hypothetical protein [Caudoviricetes sp.]